MNWTKFWNKFIEYKELAVDDNLSKNESISEYNDDDSENESDERLILGSFC